MRHSFTLTLLIFLVLLSCTKEMEQQQDTYLGTVQRSLRDSVPSSDYTMLDFERAILSKVDSAQLYFIRVPFKDKEPENDFVIAQTDKAGNIQAGKIIHLEGVQIELGEGVRKRKTFKGQIVQASLDRKQVSSSKISNGFMERHHKNKSALREDLVQPDHALPEVIVFSYATGSSSSTYVMYSSLVNAYGGGGYYSGAYYGSVGAGGGGGGSNYYSGGGGGSSPKEEQLAFVDLENQHSNPAISLESYLKCFDAVPDAGATCSIELFVDIPVDNDPNKLLNVNTGSPGHVFINLTKRNGTQWVTQNIGFYPETGWKVSLSNAPVKGKFVDNAQHEFNASFKMNLSPENFKYTLNEMLYLSKSVMYDIDEYNCTDFALDVFNATRSSKLEIPLYSIPGGMAPAGTSTPQGLFNKLKQMRNSGHPEAVNITTDIIKGWSGGSKGPCN